MRSFLLGCVLLFCAEANLAQSQIYFDNVWHGYNTGDYTAGRFPSAVKSADLDNDGDPDVVASQSNLANGFVVLLNQGGGIYSLPVAYPSPLASYDISLADFNTDGLIDVVVSNRGLNSTGNSISIYLNTGNAIFGQPINIVVGLAPVGLATGDLDGDGDPDIAVCNYSDQTVSIIKNSGAGSFGAPVNYPAGVAPYKIAAAQIDPDGQVDLIVANEGTQKMNVLFNGGNANFSTKVEYPVMNFVWGGDMYSCIRSADLDNDGDNDVLYSSSKTYYGSNLGSIGYFKNNGNGTFAPVQMLPFTLNSGGASDIEIADLNGDGWKDIIGNYFSGRETDNYQLLISDGGGGFLPAVSRPAGGGTFSLSSADVNADGQIDIITLDRNSMQITVHQNQGGGHFPMPVIYSTSNGLAGAMDAADIDADGDLDIVSSSSASSATGVTVAKNNGDGSFQTAIAYSIGGGGMKAKFRDLNGDGKPDLVFATVVSSPPYNFHTALNNGDGTFGARQTWQMNSCGWGDIDAIDMDNDGDKDVVLTESLGCTGVPFSGQRIFISKNNGDGTFEMPLIKIAGAHIGGLATGDFNKDGNIDLVTGHSQSLNIHLGTGTGDIQPPVSYITDQSPYDLIVRDFNHDGNLDIAGCTEHFYEGMSVLLGNGDGTFQAAQNYFGAYISDLRNESGTTSGDIDADGDLDIMVTGSTSNDLCIYLNDGTGHFVFRSRVGVYYGAAAPIFADFTGDCKPDLAAVVLRPFYLFDAGSVTVLKGNSPCGVIPVRLISIKAEAEFNGISILWEADNEDHLAYYEVEKSTDGRAFISIGRRNALNSLVRVAYSLTDHNPVVANNYYRLKIIDQDGTFRYSTIVRVNFGEKSQNVFVFPNPVQGNTISLQFNGLKRDQYEIVLYSALGQLVYKKSIFHQGGSLIKTLQMPPGLLKGLYRIEIISDQSSYGQSLLIQ